MNRVQVASDTQTYGSCVNLYIEINNAHRGVQLCQSPERELNCRHKSYSSRIVLFLVWIDRCNNPTSIFTNCLIVAKYPCIKWLWVFFLLRRFCHMYNIENNAWPFPCHPGYHPETPISVWDAAVLVIYIVKSHTNLLGQKNLYWKETIHCQLRKGYFIVVNQIMMTIINWL